MNKRGLRLSLTVVLVGVLAACAGPTVISHKHAKATRANQLAQAVNPRAGTVESGELMSLDGQKAEQVIKAYRAEKGKVDKVRLITEVAD